MFEDMTTREKTLTLIVGSLVPLVIIFLVWNSISGSLASKNQAIKNKTRELGELRLAHARAEMAVQRFATYKQESLPSNAENSVNQYQLWLQDELKNAGLQGSVSVSNRSAAESAVSASGGPVPLYRLFRLKLNRATCNLRQLTDFIYRMNQAKLLHSIKEMTIRPKRSGAGARALPTGELQVDMTFEVVCMSRADADRAFENEVHEESKRILDEYHNVVSRRDLFGLPNNKPQIGASTSHEFKVGSNVSIDLEAEDSDSGQTLTFPNLEDLEWELDDEDAGFDASSVSITEDGVVEMGRLPLGSYGFIARVSDNGWPKKTDEKQIRIEVVEEESQPPPTIRPEARDSYISGKTTLDGTIAQIWIRVNPQDKLLMLLEGESFELDQKTWTVVKIEEETVLIDCDGQKLKFKIGSSLSDPVKDNISALQR